MKTKLGVVLTIFLITTLAFVGTGCKKTTGGGWFTDYLTGEKITLGFTAQPIDSYSAKGKFQLIDHGSKINIHGTFNITDPYSSDPECSYFEGDCSINGEVIEPLLVIFCDSGEPGVQAEDAVEIFAGSYHYYGVLEGGNIQLH